MSTSVINTIRSSKGIVGKNKYKKPHHLTFKSIVRVKLFPLAAAILNKLGVSWKKLGRSKLGSSTLLAQGKQLSKTISPKKTNKPLKVYFLTMLGGHVHNVSVEIILAWGLKQRGHEVYFIIDDQTFPITEEKIINHEQRWDNISAHSYYFGLNYIRSCGLSVLTVSNIIDSDQHRDISEFTSIVEASLLKHYKVGLIKEHLPQLAEKKAMLMESARIGSLIGDYLLKQKPDRVIMSHGIYTSWGPAFQILNKANIPIITYGRGIKANTKKYNWNTTGDWWDIKEEWERIKLIPLSETQLQNITRYLKTRVNHSEDVMVYNFGGVEERERTIERFNLDIYKTTYTLFTNVLWDAASAQREIAFANPVEWVFETIEWFRIHPEKQLIVKIHPAEKVIGTNQPFAQLILERIKLPLNVRLIKPEEEVNSWSIYKVTDLGLVHTSTVGMELSLLGIPCVVVSHTHYRDKGFTIDINNKQEYFDFIESFKPNQEMMSFKKILAERYFYILFEKYQLPFNFFDERKSLNTLSFNFDNINSLVNDSTFSMILSNIENKKNFILNE